MLLAQWSKETGSVRNASALSLNFRLNQLKTDRFIVENVGLKNDSRDNKYPLKLEIKKPLKRGFLIKKTLILNIKIALDRLFAYNIMNCAQRIKEQ